jgi:hypothetical protein
MTIIIIIISRSISSINGISGRTNMIKVQSAAVAVHSLAKPDPSRCTRWFKYDLDYLCVNKSQFVPVIFEPPYMYKEQSQSKETFLLFPYFLCFGSNHYINKVTEYAMYKVVQI